MTSCARRRPARAAITVMVLAAVLLLQWFGAVHRIAHAPSAAVVHTAHEAAPQAASAEADELLASLFGTHDDDGDCQLFDQLSHAHALAFTLPPTLPALQPAAPPCLHRSWHLAVEAAGYLARGPPRLA